MDEATKLQHLQHAHDCAHYIKQISEWAKEFIMWIEEEDADKEQIIGSLKNLADRAEEESAVWSVKKLLINE